MPLPHRLRQVRLLPHSLLPLNWPPKLQACNAAWLSYKHRLLPRVSPRQNVSSLPRHTCQTYVSIWKTSNDVGDVSRRRLSGHLLRMSGTRTGIPDITRTPDGTGPLRTPDAGPRTPDVGPRTPDAAGHRTLAGHLRTSPDIMPLEGATLTLDHPLDNGRSTGQARTAHHVTTDVGLPHHAPRELLPLSLTLHLPQQPGEKMSITRLIALETLDLTARPGLPHALLPVLADTATSDLALADTAVHDLAPANTAVADLTPALLWIATTGTTLHAAGTVLVPRLHIRVFNTRPDTSHLTSRLAITRFSTDQTMMWTGCTMTATLAMSNNARPPNIVNVRRELKSRLLQLLPLHLGLLRLLQLLRDGSPRARLRINPIRTSRLPSTRCSLGQTLRLRVKALRDAVTDTPRPGIHHSLVPRRHVCSPTR